MNSLLIVSLFTTSIDNNIYIYIKSFSTQLLSLHVFMIYGMIVAITVAMTVAMTFVTYGFTVITFLLHQSHNSFIGLALCLGIPSVQGA